MVNVTNLEDLRSQLQTEMQQLLTYTPVGIPLVAVDNTSETFTIAGDHTEFLFTGDSFEVSGSTANDGVYTISSSIFDSVNTVITVQEDIVDGTVDGSIFFPGVADVVESKVVQQFQDAPEQYPCVYLRFAAGTSPSRYTGTADLPLYSVEIFCLALRPSRMAHLVTCEDGRKRSGRELVEYVALKLHKFLANPSVGFEPSFNYSQTDVDLELDSDYEERDGVFRSTLLYQVMV